MHRLFACLFLLQATIGNIKESLCQLKDPEESVGKNAIPGLRKCMERAGKLKLQATVLLRTPKPKVVDKTDISTNLD